MFKKGKGSKNLIKMGQSTRNVTYSEAQDQETSGQNASEKRFLCTLSLRLHTLNWEQKWFCRPLSVGQDLFRKDNGMMMRVKFGRDEFWRAFLEYSPRPSGSCELFVTTEMLAHRSGRGMFCHWIVFYHIIKFLRPQRCQDAFRERSKYFCWKKEACGWVEGKEFWLSRLEHSHEGRVILSEWQGMLFMPEIGSLLVLLRGSTSISRAFRNVDCMCAKDGVRSIWSCRNEVKSILRVITINLWLCDRGLGSFFPRSLLDRLQSRARAGYTGAAFLKIWRPWARNTVGIFPDNSDWRVFKRDFQKNTLFSGGVVVRMDHDGGMIPWCGVGRQHARWIRCAEDHQECVYVGP